MKATNLIMIQFFLSLYGHSLPAGSISISSDSTLIISGSADRNVKIWGLDFGDCHRWVLHAVVKSDSLLASLPSPDPSNAIVWRLDKQEPRNWSVIVQNYPNLAIKNRKFCKIRPNIINLRRSISFGNPAVSFSISAVFRRDLIQLSEI